jgi:hypothetical protein
VRFSWTGGFAGYDLRLVVTKTGRATVSQRGVVSRRFRLSRTRLNRLYTLIARADIPHLRRSYLPAPVPDGFVFVVTYHGRSVTTGDGGRPYPARLGRLLAELRDITQPGG